MNTFQSDLLDKAYEIDLDGFCKQHGFAKWFLTSAKLNTGINEAAGFYDLIHINLRLKKDYLVNSMLRNYKMNEKLIEKDIHKVEFIF